MSSFCQLLCKPCNRIPCTMYFTSWVFAGILDCNSNGGSPLVLQLLVASVFYRPFTFKALEGCFSNYINVAIFRTCIIEHKYSAGKVVPCLVTWWRTKTWHWPISVIIIVFVACNEMDLFMPHGRLNEHVCCIFFFTRYFPNDNISLSTWEGPSSVYSYWCFKVNYLNV